MLGLWCPHTKYQQNLIDFLKSEIMRCSKFIEAFETSILKLHNLNLDSIVHSFAPLFSNTGRPSNQQPEMFKALILMIDQKEESIDR